MEGEAQRASSHVSLWQFSRHGGRHRELPHMSLCGSSQGMEGGTESFLTCLSVAVLKAWREAQRASSHVSLWQFSRHGGRHRELPHMSLCGSSQGMEGGTESFLTCLFGNTSSALYGDPKRLFWGRETSFAQLLILSCERIFKA